MAKSFYGVDGNRAPLPASRGAKRDDARFQLQAAAGRRRVGLLSRAQVIQPFARGSLELALTLVDSVELQGLVIVGGR